MLHAEPGRVKFGIANDEHGFFDPRGRTDVGERFLDHPLLVRVAGEKPRVRRIVPYNVALRPVAREAFRRFYERAVAKGAEIMIAFQYRDARVTGREDGGARRHLPSIREYVAAVRAFRAAFPAVRLHSAWNEPDNPVQPTSRDGEGAERAAGYTVALQELCRRKCEVIAADISTEGDWADYLRRYATAVMRRAAERGVAVPRIWGLHPYRDVWELTDVRIRRFAQMVKTIAGPSLPSPAPHIWLTEVGSRLTPREGFPDRSIGRCRQAREVLHLAEMLEDARRSPVERAYYYQWREPFPDKARRSWDSGLLSPAGKARPALRALRSGSLPPTCR